MEDSTCAGMVKGVCLGFRAEIIPHLVVWQEGRATPSSWHRAVWGKTFPEGVGGFWVLSLQSPGYQHWVGALRKVAVGVQELTSWFSAARAWGERQEAEGWSAVPPLLTRPRLRYAESTPLRLPFRTMLYLTIKLGGWSMKSPGPALTTQLSGQPYNKLTEKKI